MVGCQVCAYGIITLHQQAGEVLHNPDAPQAKWGLSYDPGAFKERISRLARPCERQRNQTSSAHPLCGMAELRK
jgi:hypothetical protein